jgi:hypothetical protein
MENYHSPHSVTLGPLVYGRTLCSFGGTEQVSVPTRWSGLRLFKSLPSHVRKTLYFRWKWRFFNIVKVYRFSESIRNNMDWNLGDADKDWAIQCARVQICNSNYIQFY